MKISESPLAGSSVSNWLRLLGNNWRIPPSYWPRVLFVTCATLAFLPFRLTQSLLFGRRVREAEIRADPVFIIGHYRSGTTHLQNLMAQDSRFGFVSTTQAVLPGAFLLGRGVRTMLGLFMPDKRPMDDMAMSPTLPEEPEHAIGNLSRCCFYHGFCFPRKMMHYFERYVMFEGAAPSVIEEWKAVYLRVLRAATLACDGRQLVIKNPADTARIPTLLEMFPNARFIFLYRNPYVMFPSIRNFYAASIRDWQLQDIAEEDLTAHIFTIYEQMHGRYEADKGRIPAGNLVELRFEDLEQDPLAALEHLYADLRLDGFKEARPAIADHLAAQTRYRKNAYSLDPEIIERISQRWGSEIDRWGYGIPEGLAQPRQRTQRDQSDR